jgi:hypothetical protein
VALCTDVEVIDDFPEPLSHVDRAPAPWVRGDWQLLPWLWRTVPTQSGARVRNVLPSVARWKIADNLRRSLLPIALLILLAAVGWCSRVGRLCGRHGVSGAVLSDVRAMGPDLRQPRARV